MVFNGSFRHINVAGWRQFSEVDITFHERLTVITGANASGKSTLLSILARHFNWNRVYSSAPRHRMQSEVPNGDRRDENYWEVTRAPDPGEGGAVGIGELEYGTGGITSILAPGGRSHSHAQYDLMLPQQQWVGGLNLTSHRTVAGGYSQVSTIPTIFGSIQQVLDQFTNELRNRWSGSYSSRTPALALKETLLAAAVFGESGSRSVDANPIAAEIWLGFQDVLTKILPPSLRFKRLRARVPDLILETDTGDFIIDESSGGVSALIEVSWQIFLSAHADHPNSTKWFTVLFDEPENHLHPSLQRRIVPALLDAFPQVQFILATHSPFIVTASPDSAVYALEYSSDGGVHSRALDYTNKAASAQETLTRVLGVESTLPIWAERKYENLLAKYLALPNPVASLPLLRDEMEQAGLVSEFPLALAAFARQVTGDFS